MQPGKTVRSVFFWSAVWILAASELAGAIGLKVNTTPSLPIGIYIRDGLSPIVEFCPPPHGGNSIYRAHGICPDGGAPLLKPIVAAAGDYVDLSADGVSVNGRLLPNSAPLAIDSKGRTLQHYRFGKYLVKPGTVWVISSYNPNSFDSRYFGPIKSESVRDHLRITFAM